MNRHPDSCDGQPAGAAKRRLISLLAPPLALLAAAALAGCQTNSPDQQADAISARIAATNQTNIKHAGLDLLREGDTVKISFPGSPTMDTVEQIRPDGKIRMPLIGEVDVAGLTASELEQKLVDLYGAQLTTKQITVEVQNASFPIYVAGMVQHSGKIMSDHPLTVLDAVMEAGGFDESQANEKDVIVMRREGNVMKRYRVNLKAVLSGTANQPFWLKPGDIVYVPERFSWF